MSRHCWVLLAGVLSITAARAEAPRVVPTSLPISDTRVANGLRVILAPDQSVVSVVVEIRYGTGTAHEGVSRAGFAHVLEKLMFAGSLRVADFDARIHAAGGWSSGVTSADHVSVFEQAPAGALPLVVWLEAERMAGVPDAIDARRLAEVRRAIAAQPRSASEGQPTGLVPRAVQQALWPSHPNHSLVLDEATGSAEVTAVALP